MTQQLISRSVVCLSNYLCLLRIVKHVKTILHVGAAYEQSYGKGLVHMYWAGSFVLNGDLLGQALNELNLIRCLVCPQSRCPKRTALNAVLFGWRLPWCMFCTVCFEWSSFERHSTNHMRSRSRAFNFFRSHNTFLGIWNIYGKHFVPHLWDTMILPVRYEYLNNKLHLHRF